MQACGGLLGLHTSTTVSEPGAHDLYDQVMCKTPSNMWNGGFFGFLSDRTQGVLCAMRNLERFRTLRHSHSNIHSIAFYLNHIQLQPHSTSITFLSHIMNLHVVGEPRANLQVLLTNDTTASVDSMDCQRLRLVQW